MSHTHGKLRAGGSEISLATWIKNEYGNTIATMRKGEKDWDNARRLVTCWNSCDGISTEKLESGRVILLSEDFAKEKDHQKYALIKALRDIVMHENISSTSMMLAACAAIQLAEEKL